MRRLLLPLLILTFVVQLQAVLIPGEALPPGPSAASEERLLPATTDPRYPVNIVGHLALPYVETFAVNGDIIYCLAVWGLFVVDASDPMAPVVVSQVFFDAGIYSNGIGVSGTHVYLIRRGTGTERYLVSVDVSNPAAPVISGECLLESLGYCFINYGQYLVILDSGNIAIVDISNPAAPQPVAMQYRASGWRGVMRGDKLFTIEGADVRVVDLSVPTAPTTVTTYTEFVDAKYLTGEGDRLYVVDRTGDDTNEIVALDISAPAAPVRLGAYNGPLYGQIDVIDANVYGTRGQNEYVHVIDFNNPAEPVRVGSVPTQSWGAMAVGHQLYFELLNKISIFSATNPAAPVLIGSYEGTYSWAHDIDVRGNLAAIACGHLILADITDRAHPQMLASWYPPGYGAWSVELVDGIAYVADGEAINALDISDPANPVLTGRVVEPYLSMNVLIDGDRAYSTGGAGVQFIDLSDPLHPVAEMVYSEPGMEYTTSMQMRDQTLFVHWFTGAETSTVSFLDVTVPSAPVKLGEYVSAYSAQGKDIALAGDYLCLIEGGGHFDVIDISSPATPAKVGSEYLKDGRAYGSVVDGDYVFTGARSLSIVDLYSPWYPQEVSTNFYGDRGEAIEFEGGNLFLYANGSLYVLEAPVPVILNGDCDNTGEVSVSDAVFMINFIFSDGPEPLPYRSADVNCDRLVTISDAVYLIMWVFGGGPAPCQQ